MAVIGTAAVAPCQLDRDEYLRKDNNAKTTVIPTAQAIESQTSLPGSLPL